LLNEWFNDMIQKEYYAEIGSIFEINWIKEPILYFRKLHNAACDISRLLEKTQIDLDYKKLLDIPIPDLVKKLTNQDFISSFTSAGRFKNNSALKNNKLSQNSFISKDIEEKVLFFLPYEPSLQNYIWRDGSLFLGTTVDLNNENNPEGKNNFILYSDLSIKFNLLKINSSKYEITEFSKFHILLNSFEKYFSKEKFTEFKKEKLNSVLNSLDFFEWTSVLNIIDIPISLLKNAKVSKETGLLNIPICFNLIDSEKEFSKSIFIIIKKIDLEIFNKCNDFYPLLFSEILSADEESQIPEYLLKDFLELFLDLEKIITSTFSQEERIKILSRIIVSNKRFNEIFLSENYKCQFLEFMKDKCKYSVELLNDFYEITRSNFYFNY